MTNLPHPETNSEGIEIYLAKAETTAVAAPKIPDRNNVLTRKTLIPDVNDPADAPRRSPLRQDARLVSQEPPSLYLDSSPHANGAISTAGAGAEH